MEGILLHDLEDKNLVWDDKWDDVQPNGFQVQDSNPVLPILPCHMWYWALPYLMVTVYTVWIGCNTPFSKVYAIFGTIFGSAISSYWILCVAITDENSYNNFSNTNMVLSGNVPASFQNGIMCAVLVDYFTFVSSVLLFATLLMGMICPQYMCCKQNSFSNPKESERIQINHYQYHSIPNSYIEFRPESLPLYV